MSQPDSGALAVARTDARYLLPSQPRTALVLGGLELWREGLSRVDIEEPSGSDAPDLVVAPAAMATAAAKTGAGMVLLEGHASRQLARSGLSVRSFLALPRADDARLFLPLDAPRAARYALRFSDLPEERWRLVRNRLVTPIIARGIAPGGNRRLTLGTREAGAPFLVSAARRPGIPAAPEWYVTTTQGNALARGALQLLGDSSDAPSWTVKFGRLPGHASSFDGDERGMRLVSEAGGSVAAHAPRLLGRLDVNGIPASVETTARGHPLGQLLRSPGRRSAKLSVIEEIAGWIVRMGVETRAHPDRLTAERARLADEVVARWPSDEIAPDLVSALSPVPAVLEHNDLGPPNVMVRSARAFTVIDWSQARRPGMPLWDLWCLLADAVAELDRVAGPDQRLEHFRRLFRGELPLSPLVFAWTRRAAQACGVEHDAVGPLATLCWLDRGRDRSDRAHVEEALGLSEAGRGWLRLSPRIAELWLADPALGPGWSVWRT